MVVELTHHCMLYLFHRTKSLEPSTLWGHPYYLLTCQMSQRCRSWCLIRTLLARFWHITLDGQSKESDIWWIRTTKPSRLKKSSRISFWPFCQQDNACHGLSLWPCSVCPWSAAGVLEAGNVCPEKLHTCHDVHGMLVGTPTGRHDTCTPAPWTRALKKIHIFNPQHRCSNVNILSWYSFISIWPLEKISVIFNPWNHPWNQ